MMPKDKARFRRQKSQYAIFKPGTARLKLVMGDTQNALDEFWSFLISDECSCPCKKYFGAE